MFTRRLVCALLAALLMLSACLAEPALPGSEPEIVILAEDEIVSAAQAEDVEAVPAELPSFELGDSEADAAPVEEASEAEPAEASGPESVDIVEAPEPTEAETALPSEPDTAESTEASDDDPAASESAAPESAASDADEMGGVAAEPSPEAEPDEVEAEPAADAPEAVEASDDLAVETLPEEMEVVRQPGVLTEAAPVPATGLTARKLSLVIGKGENAALNVTAQPQGATLGALTYVSSKPKVASVSADGQVRGVKRGKAAITVTSDTGLRLTLSVQVMNAPKKVKLKLPKPAIGVGEAMAPSVKFPKKSGGGCTFSVDGSGVLRFDAASGTVVGVKPGTGVLTVRTYNNKAASAKITVCPAPGSLAPSVPAMELIIGGKASFTAVLPKGTMASIKYASSNPGIVAIDAAGRVTGVAGGTATLTATAHNGVTCQCLAYVLPKPASFALKSTAVELLVGESYTPEITTVPADACKTLKLSTKDKKIVTVKNGVIKGKKKGTARIIVKTVNGLKARLTVKLMSAPS